MGGAARAAALLAGLALGAGGGAAPAAGHGRAAPVDGGSIYFQNVTHTSAVVRWEPAGRGNWRWDIQGYRIRMRSFLHTEGNYDVGLGDPAAGGTDMRNVTGAGGVSCNCHDYCWLELSSPAPCTEAKEGEWVGTLGHAEGTYLPCHRACCRAVAC